MFTKHQDTFCVTGKNGLLIGSAIREPDPRARTQSGVRAVSLTIVNGVPDMRILRTNVLPDHSHVENYAILFGKLAGLDGEPHGANLAKTSSSQTDHQSTVRRIVGNPFKKQAVPEQKDPSELTDEEQALLARVAPGFSNERVPVSDMLPAIRSTDDFLYYVGRNGAPACSRYLGEVHGVILKLTGKVNVAMLASALKACPDASMAAIRYYGSAPSEEVMLRRHQAAAAYPLLAGMIASDRQMARLVDESKPINERLLEMTGLTKGGLRALSKIQVSGDRTAIAEHGEHLRGEDAIGVNRMRAITMSGKITLQHCLTALKSLPPEWVPANDKDWCAFVDLMSATQGLTDALAIPPSELFIQSKGKWSDYLKTLALNAGFDQAHAENVNRHLLATTVLDALQMTSMFTYSLLGSTYIKDIVAHDLTIPAFDAFYTDKLLRAGVEVISQKSDLGNIFKVGRRFISRMQTFLEADPNDNGEGMAALREVFRSYDEFSAPRVCQDFVASNGLIVENITTLERMKLESSRNGICIGEARRPYYKNNSAGKRHYFSVTSPDGQQTFATVETTSIADGDRNLDGLEVIQNRGVHNATPVKPALQAWSEFFQALKSGNIRVNWEEIEDNFTKKQVEAGQEKISAPQRQKSAWEQLCGPAIESPEKFDLIAQGWADVVGPKAVQAAIDEGHDLAIKQPVSLRDMLTVNF